MSSDVTGRIHSIQTMGTLDGPGVRFVAFLQGCPLRCACCHNPDTWAVEGGQSFSPKQLVEKALRYRPYFGRSGGVTLSGGEPLLQADFCREYFCLCHENSLHTCLDTSGCLLTDPVKALLAHTDRVLLDLKYVKEADYRAHVGCSMAAPLRFLQYLNEQKIPTTLRQVIIPTINDLPENVQTLKTLARQHPCVDKIELLPFRKICQVKYDQMGIPFLFGHLPEPSPDQMKELEKLLEDE